MELNNLLSRKIISASITSTLFAILLGLFVPNPFGETISSTSEYFLAFVTATPVYLMYSFPVILIYGVLTSSISDRIAQIISTKADKQNFEGPFSFILHIIFGLILLIYSLVAAILFFMTDRFLLKSNNDYTLLKAAQSLVIPISVFLILWGLVYFGL